MNLDVRYYIPLKKGSKDLETACIFHTPFKTKRHAISYARGKLKSIAKNVRVWKLDEEFLNNSIKQLMETTIKGQQVTATVISENCRISYGKAGALEVALEEIREKYEFTLNAPVNEKATIRIVMTIDRGV